MPDGMRDDRVKTAKGVYCRGCKTRTHHVYTKGGAAPMVQCTRCLAISERPTPRTRKG